MSKQEIEKIKVKLRDDYGWLNLDKSEFNWFIDSLISDIVDLVKK